MKQVCPEGYAFLRLAGLKKFRHNINQKFDFPESDSVHTNNLLYMKVQLNRLDTHC
jgi:hypothetical protein